MRSRREIQFVVTSDAHYGLTRPAFRGGRNVDAQVVNAALVARLNALPAMRFPNDGGIRAGAVGGPIDFVVEAGDIANREEVGEGARIQPASASWGQFVADYVDGMHVTDRAGTTPVLVVPGNHEASNAVGFYKPMTPPSDMTPLVEIYNRMMMPPCQERRATFDYRPIASSTRATSAECISCSSTSGPTRRCVRGWNEDSHA